MTDWYTASGNPTQGSAGASNVLRSEYNSIATAFSKMPALTGYNGLLVGVNSSGTALQTYSYAEIASALTFVNLEYTGTLTGSTGVMNIGSGQLYKDSSGNVGIGTTAPNAKLDVRGFGQLLQLYGNSSANQTPDLSIVRSSSATIIQEAPNITFFDGTTNYTRAIQSGLGNLQFFAYRGSWIEDMRIDSSGNVGIGTNAPGAQFSVNKTAGQYGAAAPSISTQYTGLDVFKIYMDSSWSTHLAAIQNSSNLSALAFDTNDTERMRIDSSGNVGIGTSSPITKLDVNGAVTQRNGSGTIIGTITNNSGWYDFGGSTNVSGAQMSHATAIRFLTNSTERMRIDSTGALLVNQTTADTGAKLSVTGGIKGTITSGTAVATTSGTAIDFTGIPSWVKKITVMFNGVGFTGSDALCVRVGSGSIQTTGYSGASMAYGVSSVASIQLGASFALVCGTGDVLTSLRSGVLVMTLLSNNVWIASGQIGMSNTVFGNSMAGSISLSGALDRIRILPSGANSFDAGSVNILYEG